MTEHTRKLGGTGLSYGTQAAEEMIAERTRKLEGRGYPDARSAAIGQLADEGNLRVLREVTTRSVSLAEASGAGREVSAEEEISRLLATLSELEQLDCRQCQEVRAGGAEHPTQPFGWTLEAWLLTRLAGWVSENPRHQGFAAKTLPELDALAEPTGADA